MQRIKTKILKSWDRDIQRTLHNPAKMAEKWPRFGGPWTSWELAWTVDRLRTSADKRMWSGRRAVVLRTGRRAELIGVKLGCPRSRCRTVVSDVFCVRSYVLFVCVCVYVCMCVCVQTCEDCFYYCSSRDYVVVLFGTLKVQSFMLTEVRDCDCWLSSHLLLF